MKNIVQGSFQHDWIHKNMMKDESMAHKQRRLPPQTTKASEGHALKTKTLLDPQEKDIWKMKKFTNVQPKVGVLTLRLLLRTFFFCASLLLDISAEATQYFRGLQDESVCFTGESLCFTCDRFTNIDVIRDVWLCITGELEQLLTPG
jgi:hypothetical protein